MTNEEICKHLEEIEGYFRLCLDHSADGSMAEKMFRATVTAAKEAREIIDRTPRLMTGEAFRAQPMGTGWLEWYPQDGEEDCLFGVAWVGGEMLLTDDTGCASMGQVPEDYNRQGGFRVWTDRPTDRQRKEAAWDD